MNVAAGIAFVGGLTLLVGLSLNWYEPEISAWTAFEVADILLAAIAIGVVAVAAGRSPERPLVEGLAAWLPIAALAALVLVVVSLINPPPAAIDAGLETGAWVSLAGAVLLVLAAVLATTYVSLVVTVRPRPPRRRPAAEEAGGGDAEWEEPFDAPAADESPTDERPLEVVEEPEPYEDEPLAPAEEGPMEPPESAEPPDDESETRPFPPR